MKNLFGFDGKNKSVNNSGYVIRDLDGVEDSKRLDEVVRNNLTARKNALLPAWFVLLAVAVNFAGLILLCLGLPDESTDFTQTNLIFIIVGGVLFVLGMTVLAICFVRIKKLKANPYYQQSLAEEEKLTDEALKVPENSEKIDILVLNKPSKFPVYNLQTMKVFKENGLLCFSDNYEVTGIPLSQVMTVYAVNSKTRFTTLENISKEKRRTFNIRRSINKNDIYITDSRLAAEVQLDGEQFEIVVAGYHAEAFTKLLNKTTVIT